MKKLLALTVVGFLTISLASCNSDASSSKGESENNVESSGDSAMDSLSVLFGDLYGAGISKAILKKDSTANLKQTIKEMETVLGVDTISVRYSMQVIELFQGIEKTLGKPLNKDLFIKHLRENMMAGNIANDEKITEMQQSIEALMEKVSPGITNQEPINFTTQKGTYNIEQVLKRMHEEGVSDGSSKRSLHDKIPSSFTKSKMRQDAKSNFKQKWVIWYGMPDNEEAKAVYNDALEEYMKGFEDGWNF